MLSAACALGAGESPADRSPTTNATTTEPVTTTTIAAATTTAGTTSTSTTTTGTTSTTTSSTTSTTTTTTEQPEPVERLARAVVLPGLPGTELDAATAAHLEAGGAGLFLQGPNVSDADQLRALTSDAACTTPGPLLIAVDQELGPAVRRLGDLVTPMLTPEEALEASPAIVEDAAYLLATEMLDLGINVDLAPVVDVVTGPNPVLAGRHLGPDPEIVAEVGSAVVRGMADGGVIAVPKHFPGLGRSESEPRSGGVVIDAEAGDLAGRDWLPFERAFADGAAAVMIGHPVYTAIDPNLPASISPVVLALLRGRFRFDGVAITDSLSLARVTDERSPGEVAVAALTAGEDLLLVQDPGRVDETIAAIVAAVEDGTLPRERLEEAAGRVRALAAAAGAVECRR